MPIDVGLDRLARLSGAKPQGNHDTSPWGAPEKVGHKLERCAVGPVEIVEYQNHGLLGRQALDQLAHRSVSAVACDAVVGSSEPGSRDRSAGEPPELPQRLRGQAMEHARGERLEVFVERVDDQAERELTLESAAHPLNARQPRSSARNRSSSRSDDLPIPGSPLTNRIWADPRTLLEQSSSRSNSHLGLRPLGQSDHRHSTE